MSGGSWDYFCHQCDDVAGNLCSESSPLRRAFGEHMKLVAKAMHDIEWVDSCDYGKGDEVEAIKAVFEGVEDNPELKVLIDELKKYTAT